MKENTEDLKDKDWISYPLKIAITLCLLLIVILSGLLYFAYKPTSNFYGEVFSHGVTDKQIIALTFDDGPNGKATTDTLDILKKENIKATFFVVGDNVKYYPDIAKEIVSDGNEIENHSMHHVRRLPFRSELNIEKDLLGTNSVIYQTTGQIPKYFRPPFGFRTPWVLAGARHAGFTVITWNDLTSDFKSVSAVNIKDNILAIAKPGSIIDLHDGSGTIHGANRDAMLQALPEIIDTLKAKGYSFVTVDQMVNESVKTAKK